VLPPGGFVPLLQDPIGNVRSMVLPSITLSLYLAPPLVRFVRASVAQVRKEEYVKVARAKGVRRTRLLTRHVAPNALLPAVTYVGLQLGVLVSGALVTEVIFALPGMGSMGLNAILNRDYPLVQGVVLVVAVGYLIANMLVDLAYTMLDPRIRFR
jgi:peptide/nickel transport system permease protein